MGLPPPWLASLLEENDRLRATLRQIAGHGGPEGCDGHCAARLTNTAHNAMEALEALERRAPRMSAAEYARRCWPPDYEVPDRLRVIAIDAAGAGLGRLSVDQLDGLACIRCGGTTHAMVPLPGFFGTVDGVDGGHQLFQCEPGNPAGCRP